MKPDFKLMWSSFPDHVTYPNLEALYTHLGGAAQKNIHVEGFGADGNACASRMSVALNKAGSVISQDRATAAGARSIGTNTGGRIIYGVSDLRKYLRYWFGKPSVDDKVPFHDAFRDRQGIVTFLVNWRGATGHIALWNGHAFREPRHDDYATYVNQSTPSVKTTLGELWEIR